MSALEAPRIDPALVAHLAGVRRRKHLARDPVYAEHRALIEAHTHALVRRDATPAPAAHVFVRALSWNVLRGANLDPIVAFLRDDPLARTADVLLLNEVDRGMARSANRDVAGEVAAALGLHCVFGNSYLCLDHGDARDREGLDPSLENGEAMHGNAILSRFPIRRAENVVVSITKDKFHSAEKRLGSKKALWAELDTPWGPLPVCAAHLDSIAAPAQRADQLRDALAALPEGPALMGGDLNTTTYDLSGPAALVRNLGGKLLRGGFPHAMHSYMHPYARYDRVVFEVIEAAGFDWRGFNDLSTGTLRYEVGDFHSESAVADHVPDFAVRYLRRKLKPWNGVAPMRVDWFAGRGLRALADREVAGSRAPSVLERAAWGGARLSDHAPILTDVLPAG